MASRIPFRIGFLVLLSMAACPALGLNFDELNDRIRTQHFTSIAQVLADLPETYREGFTLMRTSHSEQDASPREPRAILFGDDAKLILAFNGASHQLGYEALEAIQFRDDTKQFEFHRITFPTDEAIPGEVSFSETNPPICMRCHTEHLRPNWEQYPNWTGAYGENDDYPQGTELESLKQFIAQALPQGRYRFLARTQGSEASPYETKERGRLRFRPNFRLSALNFAHQAEALLALLEKDPRFGKFRFLYVMSRLRCDGHQLNWEAELKKLFGEKAAGRFGPWTAPDATNSYAYIARDVGLLPRVWTPAFSASPLPKEDPYFFQCGIPKIGIDGKYNTELSDAVMSRMVEQMVGEIPALGPYYKLHRWVEERFAADPLDKPLATLLDDALAIYDHGSLVGACPILAREYEAKLASSQ